MAWGTRPTPARQVLPCELVAHTGAVLSIMDVPLDEQLNTRLCGAITANLVAIAPAGRSSHIDRVRRHPPAFGAPAPDTSRRPHHGHSLLPCVGLSPVLLTRRGLSPQATTHTRRGARVALLALVDIYRSPRCWRFLDHHLGRDS